MTRQTTWRQHQRKCQMPHLIKTKIFLLLLLCLSGSFVAMWSTYMTYLNIQNIPNIKTQISSPLTYKCHEHSYVFALSNVGCNW